MLISEDDEGNPDKTVNAYQKLTSKDKVKLIIGSLTSGCTQAITNRAQAQKVVQIAPAAFLYTFAFSSSPNIPGLNVFLPL